VRAEWSADLDLDGADVVGLVKVELDRAPDAVALKEVRAMCGLARTRAAQVHVSVSIRCARHGAHRTLSVAHGTCLLLLRWYSCSTNADVLDGDVMGKLGRGLYDGG
jgi:hypothetical protein